MHIKAEGGLEWDKLNLPNAEKLEIVHFFFREVDMHHGDAWIQDIKMIVHVELTLGLESRVKVFVNYSIYRYIRELCERESIIVPDMF